MKSILISAFFLCTGITYAQETTLYEYGQKVTSAEINFKNLFDNVPKYVNTNGTVMIDMISYQFVGEVKSKEQVRKMISQNFHHVPLYGWGLVSGNNAKGVVNIEGSSVPISKVFNTKEAVKTISNIYVSSGDSIYLLTFVINMETYRQYVFVKKDTHKVIEQGNFWATKIPLSTIYSINKVEKP